MQNDIIAKLRDHLNNGIHREADVVYLFVEVGKYLEQEREAARSYLLLWFYRNWVSHSQIDRTRLVDEIAETLDSALAASSIGNTREAMAQVLQVMHMDKLRDALQRFCRATYLPTTSFDEPQTWKELRKLLIRVLVDIPLLFTGFKRLAKLRFTEKFSDRQLWLYIDDHHGGGMTLTSSQLW